MDNKRNITVDIMKGFLIIAVVIGHSYWELGKIFFWFHMPAFFMISGYLLNIPERKDEKGWILRKCRSFLLPYLVYTLISGAFELPNGSKAAVTRWVRCLYGGELAPGVFWFITVLLFSEVFIVLAENRIKNRYVRTGIYSAMYLAAIAESIVLIPPVLEQIPTYTKFPWNADVCLLAVPYIAVGMLFRRNQEKLKKALLSGAGIAAAVIGAAGLSALLYFTDAVEWFTLDMKNSQYKNVLLDMLCPVLAIIIIWYISKLLSGNFAGRALAYLGQRSITVMYLNFLIKDKLMIPVFGDKYSILLYTAAVIVISLLWDLLLSRIPPLAPLFGVKPCEKKS